MGRTEDEGVGDRDHASGEGSWKDHCLDHLGKTGIQGRIADLVVGESDIDDLPFRADRPAGNDLPAEVRILLEGLFVAAAQQTDVLLNDP